MLIQAVYKYPYPLCLKLVFFAVERQQRIMHSTWPGQDGLRASQPVVRISLTANPEACITILLRKKRLVFGRLLCLLTSSSDPLRLDTGARVLLGLTGSRIEVCFD